MQSENLDQNVAQKLESMEAADLIELSRTIEQQIGNRMAARRQEAVGKVREIAKEYGLAVDQLCDLARGRKGKPPKYRHPKDHDLTWTGLGRRPQWLLNYIGEGGALEDLRI